MGTAERGRARKLCQARNCSLSSVTTPGNGGKRNETKGKIWHETPSTFDRQARERMCSSLALNPTSQASLGTPSEHEMLEHLSVELRRQVSHGAVAQQSLHSL